MSYSVSLCHPMLTRSLGAILARVGYHNDTVLLYGKVGVGKSEIARGYIREATGDENTIVASPTFMIENQYECSDDRTIHHIDLYRLIPGDIIPIDFNHGVKLIEWPQILDKESLFPERVEISVSLVSEGKEDNTYLSDDEFDCVGFHQADIKFYGNTWKERIHFVEPILHFIENTTSFNDTILNDIRGKFPSRKDICIKKE